MLDRSMSDHGQYLVLLSRSRKQEMNCGILSRTAGTFSLTKLEFCQLDFCIGCIMF